jgi:ABC-type molybdate transport system substrate-binding protein
MKEVPPVVYSACVLKNAKDIERAVILPRFLFRRKPKHKKKYGYKQSPGER